MKLITLALATTLVLGGCASSVQLDSPPIEDKSPVASPDKPRATSAGSPNGTVAGSTTKNTSGGVAANPSPPAGSTGSNTAIAGSPTQVTAVNAEDPTKPGLAPVNVTKVLYFDVDSFQIKPEYLPILEAHAKWFKSSRNRRAAIEGHTDSTGSNEYNIALGQRRADAVVRALTLLGVTESQLESVSFGEEKPADPSNTEEAMAKNRRVEIFYR